MREIKFRAWDKENKFMSDVVMWHLKNGIVNTSDVRLEDGYIEEELEIMQYTGLKDKNGKEIYEGDIIKYDTGRPERVSFDNAQFTSGNDRSSTYLSKGLAGICEVIGNIYENSELLSSLEE